MINSLQLRELVVSPVVSTVTPNSSTIKDAVELLMMIQAHESNSGTYLKQVKGPALGIFQMEPDTFYEVRKYLDRHPELKYRVASLSSSGLKDPYEMIHNLAVATAMARVFFMRFEEEIPTDDYGKAVYAKKYWNTEKGKATVNDYFKAYRSLR